MTTEKTKNARSVLEKIQGPFTFALFMQGTRSMKGCSQARMAKFLGISRSSLCDIEKGRQLVSPGLASKIARKCGASEVSAVQAAVSDQLRKAKLKMTVEVHAA